jgi:hypothetical protein
MANDMCRSIENCHTTNFEVFEVAKKVFTKIKGPTYHSAERYRGWFLKNELRQSSKFQCSLT